MRKVNFNDLIRIYETEISRNVKNKKRLYDFECMKFQYLNYIYGVLTNEKYDGGRYNIFMVTYPKKRIVMSQKLCDKIINHYVTETILMPNLTKYLDDRNIATRKGYGVHYGIMTMKKYFEKLKRNGDFYCLKLDISKYFYNINHDVLKDMLKTKLEENDWCLMCKIIDTTNEPYVNKRINQLKRKYHAPDIPFYQERRGLPIGNLTSQFLAIFYFHELDHKIVHDYKLPCYLRYMDDFLIFSKDKEYLKKVSEEIKVILKEKYLVDINEKKTMILSSKDGISFLGYRFRVVDNKTIITISGKSRVRICKNIRKKTQSYKEGTLSLKEYYASLNCYYHAFPYSSSNEISNYIDKLLDN